MRNKATTLTVRNRCQILLDMDEAHGKQYLEEQCAKRCAVHIATVSYTVNEVCRGRLGFLPNPQAQC